MDWGTIVALVIAIIVILIPVAFVWYLNIGGMYAMAKQREGTTIKRTAYVALFFLVGIFFPLFIWVALGVALYQWSREMALRRLRTIDEILAAAGLPIQWAATGDNSLAPAMFPKRPASEMRELLARAGL